LFGEKYADKVRVLRVGDFSVELCGGTHASRTGDIGLLKIVSESGVASGVRRIEAQTGATALNAWTRDDQLLQRLSSELKGGRSEIEQRVVSLLDKNRELEKELKKLRGQLASGGAGQDLADQAVDINGIKVLVASLAASTDAETLRATVDRMKDKLKTGVVVLAAATADGKVRLAAGVTKDSTKKLKAGDLIKHVAEQVGGKGGGRPDFAQAGGTDPKALPAALASVPEWVREQLAS
jgi:alanyl-tRNA synthetase